MAASSYPPPPAPPLDDLVQTRQDGGTVIAATGEPNRCTGWSKQNPDGSWSSWSAGSASPTLTLTTTGTAPQWPRHSDPQPAAPLPAPPAPPEDAPSTSQTVATLQDLFSPVSVPIWLAVVGSLYANLSGKVPGMAGIILVAVLLALQAGLQALQLHTGNSNVSRVLTSKRMAALRRVRG